MTSKLPKKAFDLFSYKNLAFLKRHSKDEKWLVYKFWRTLAKCPHIHHLSINSPRERERDHRAVREWVDGQTKFFISNSSYKGACRLKAGAKAKSYSALFEMPTILFHPFFSTINVDSLSFFTDARKVYQGKLFKI